MPIFANLHGACTRCIFFQSDASKIVQKRTHFLVIFWELKYPENKRLACTPARFCIFVASNMLIFLASRQVNFGPGMLVKLQILTSLLLKRYDHGKLEDS